MGKIQTYMYPLKPLIFIFRQLLLLMIRLRIKKEKLLQKTGTLGEIANFTSSFAVRR